MSEAKILVLDIETTPLELYAWGIWDVNASLEQIRTDWSIMSFSAKWLGKKKVMYMDTGGRGKRFVRNDRKLMKPLCDLLNEADIVVAQNGKKFDIRKINARLIAHGFKPPSPYRVIDTMLMARKYFAFTSQKLAYTSDILAPLQKKDEHPEYPGFKLWLACLNDEKGAWRVLKRYNERDITATEQVYLQLRPWIENHPNLAVFIDADKPLCPKCGHDKMNSNGYRVTQATRYLRMQCQKCGGWARGKKMLTSVETRRALLLPE
jgi:uncharacterized protein YprB with RNaseH-like and TPR domain